MESFLFVLRQTARRMWFLPAAFSLLAAITVILSYSLAYIAPEELPFEVPDDAVNTILSIMASSMLTVAIFALSTVVSASAAAAQTATPRATPLIIEDWGAQTSISIFIGAFMFSVLGIIGLATGIYSQAGRLLLFGVTLAVVLLVVWALIRWIGQISSMGRVGETVRKAGDAAQHALANYRKDPLQGCRLQQDLPEEGYSVMSGKIGYVQHIDTATIGRRAEDLDITVHIAARPGTYVDPTRPLVVIDGGKGEKVEEAMRDAFTISDTRTFDFDPRFGLLVLNEIAVRALSAAVNDPGTAIHVIGTLVQVLGETVKEPPKTDDKPGNARVSMSPIDEGDLIADAFRSIARDGAGSVEVVQRLLKGLAMLQAMSPQRLGPAARSMALEVEARALGRLDFDLDREMVQHAAAWAKHDRIG